MGVHDIFDRTLKSLQRRRIVNNSESADVYYNDLGVQSIVNRLRSIKGRNFQNACYVGPMAHVWVNELNKDNFIGMKGLTVIDNCKYSLDHSLEEIKKIQPSFKVTGLHLDEEMWMFPEKYFNLIVNNLGLHWVNQVSASLERCLHSLEEDGLLLGVAMGGDTLQELRIALSLAEQERESGISNHVSPMLQLTDVGQLMIRLHYKLVTINADLSTLYFDDAFSLMDFLQSIGENNAASNRRKSISRETFIAAGAIYEHLFKEREGPYIGKLPATFDMIHYIG